MSLSTAREEFDCRREITDRVIKESERMAARAREVAYYEDLTKELRASGRRTAGSQERVVLIRKRFAEAFDEIVKGIKRTALIYRELSLLNLNPSTTVFAVTSPFTKQTLRSLTLRTVVLYLVLVPMLATILVPIGCLVHHAVRRPVAV